MKLKYRFEMMELDDEIVAVPVGKNADELHCVLNLNEVAMRILEMLKEESSEEELVSRVLSEFECRQDEAARAVHSFLDQLRQNNFLDE